MHQIYLLSIVTILLSGIALSFERLSGPLRLGAFFNAEAFSNSVFRMILGIVTFLVGFFQFLTVAPDDVPVVGDLVPAVTGLVLGATLLLGYYRSRSDVESPFMERLDRILLRNGSSLGILGIVVAVLHFLFHRVLLL